MTRYRLRNLHIDRADLVPLGANQEAHILLFKTAGYEPTPETAERVAAYVAKNRANPEDYLPKRKQKLEGVMSLSSKQRLSRPRFNNDRDIGELPRDADPPVKISEAKGKKKGPRPPDKKKRRRPLSEDQELVAKHHGPGPHPDGSDQKVHGGDRGGGGKTREPSFDLKNWYKTPAQARKKKAKRRSDIVEESSLPDDQPDKPKKPKRRPAPKAPTLTSGTGLIGGKRKGSIKVEGDISNYRFKGGPHKGKLASEIKRPGVAGQISDKNFRRFLVGADMARAQGLRKGRDEWDEFFAKHARHNQADHGNRGSVAVPASTKEGRAKTQRSKRRPEGTEVATPGKPLTPQEWAEIKPEPKPPKMSPGAKQLRAVYEREGIDAVMNFLRRDDRRIGSGESFNEMRDRRLKEANIPWSPPDIGFVSAGSKNRPGEAAEIRRKRLASRSAS